MKVWVDQDLCTGDGLCEELCPEVFTLQSGISYVQDAAGPKMQGGSTAMVDIPAHCIDSVFDAAEECPGECIFVEA
jgi:ferredoxin